MEQQTVIAGLEARAKALGVPMYEVCRRAGVAASTPSRWKGANPVGMTFSTLSKLQAALDEMEAAAAAAEGVTTSEAA
jgi:predicted transcriptional regulator